MRACELRVIVTMKGSPTLQSTCACIPTLTHIDNHLTPWDTYLITISGRTARVTDGTRSLELAAGRLVLAHGRLELAPGRLELALDFATNHYTTKRHNNKG